MSKIHSKNILFIRSLFDKPKWYNQALTHDNWPMMKKAIENLPDFSRISKPKLDSQTPSFVTSICRSRDLYDPVLLGTLRSSTIIELEQHAAPQQSKEDK